MCVVESCWAPYSTDFEIDSVCEEVEKGCGQGLAWNFLEGQSSALA
jgi:hypothetical protein